MAEYYISGVWKDENDVITHYAFHKVDNGIIDVNKKSKSMAVKLLESSSNSAMTIVWNYQKKQWFKGEKVIVVNGAHGKFLRSNPDNTEKDNLAHLIDYGIVKF